MHKDRRNIRENVWIEYEWKIKGEPALISTDISLGDAAPDYARTVLLFINCASPDPDAADLTPAQQSRCRTIEKECCKALSTAAFAGRIDMACQMQLYFYAESPKHLNELERIAQKHEKRLICTCGRTDDPNWRTYFMLLYPDAAKYQTLQNREIIDLYKRRGDVLSATRRLEFNVFFILEGTCQVFLEQARLNGFVIGKPLYRPDEDHAYGTSLYMLSPLDKPRIDELTTRVIRLAQKHDGILVDWTCPLIKKGTPFK